MPTSLAFLANPKFTKEIFLPSFLKEVSLRNAFKEKFPNSFLPNLGLTKEENKTQLRLEYPKLGWTTLPSFESFFGKTFFFGKLIS